MPDKPETFDKFPTRSPLIVVNTRDDPPKKEIKWQCYEYIGTEVFAAPPGLTFEEVLSTANWPEDFKPEPIKERDGIGPGSIILVPGLYGDIGAYLVKKLDDGTLIGRNEGWMTILDYAPDERKSWVCVGMGNLAAIKKLELTE